MDQKLTPLMRVRARIRESNVSKNGALNFSYHDLPVDFDRGAAVRMFQLPGMQFVDNVRENLSRAIFRHVR